MLIRKFDGQLHGMAVEGYALRVWDFGYGFYENSEQCYFAQSEKSIALIVKDSSLRSE